jgi:hypothetical protein
MKLKFTNKSNSDILELEGTEEELSKFFVEYKKVAQPTWPWYWTNPAFQTNEIKACLSHDFDYSSTMPTCKRCGAQAYQQLPFIVGDPILPHPYQPPYFYTVTSNSVQDQQIQ